MSPVPVRAERTRQSTAATHFNRVSVAPKGGDFSSIQAAIDSISPSAEDPWRIDIAPGTYPEVLVLQSWIHLAGSGIRGTIVLLSENVESGVFADGLVDVRLSDLTILDPLGSPSPPFPWIPQFPPSPGFPPVPWVPWIPWIPLGPPSPLQFL